MASTELSLLPPGPKGLPWLGSITDLIRDRLTFVTRNRQRYGDAVHYRLAGRNAFQFTDPRDIETILVGRQHHFLKDEITRSLSGTLGNGLLTSEGELWRHQRKLVAPSFQPRQIESYAKTMVEEAARSLSEMPIGPVFDVHPKMMALTLRVVIKTLFGTEADSTFDFDRVGRIIKGLLAEFEAYNFSWQALLPRWAPFGPGARSRRLVAELDEMLLAIIRDREGKPAGDDLLSRLHAASSDEGNRMTIGQLRDEMVTMFLAGHETTAVALSYALYLLSLHPDVSRRVAEEVRGVARDRPLTTADIPKLRFCDAVVRESMRLYPPAWTVGRQVATECPVGKYMLPAGSIVLIPQWAVHRDPRWFAEPEAFRPDRWLDGLAQRLPAFAYFPFGGGPRVCVGNHFAMMELILVLSTLIRSIEVQPVPGFQVELHPAVTLRPRGGLPLSFRQRAASNAVQAPAA
jgi:cytochrome P450